MTNPDLETLPWLRFVLASTVVLGLMALLGFVLKHINMNGLRGLGKTPASRRLQIIETLTLDVRRRLVLVRCDEAEHLLLLGANQDTVVETNHTHPKTKSST